MKRLALLLLVSVVAHVVALASPLELSSDYNVLVLGSMSASNSSIAGRVAVGGSAAMANIAIANGNNAATGDTPDSSANVYNLVVGGSLQWSNGQLANGSGIYSGTASLSNLGIPNGTIMNGAVPVDFKAAAATYKGASATFASMTSTGSSVYKHGGLTLTGENTGLNVFAVDGSTLGSANNVSIVVPDGAAVLINIVGVAGSFKNAGLKLNGKSFNHNKADAWSEMLWNFSGTGTFSLQGVDFGGTLLAPNATVTLQNGKLNGQLVAGSLTSNAQINNFRFNGTVPVIEPGENLESANVPEPGTFALAGLGALFLLLGNIRRSRRVNARVERSR